MADYTEPGRKPCQPDQRKTFQGWLHLFRFVSFYVGQPVIHFASTLKLSFKIPFHSSISFLKWRGHITQIWHMRRSELWTMSCLNNKKTNVRTGLRKHKWTKTKTSAHVECIFFANQLKHNWPLMNNVEKCTALIWSKIWREKNLTQMYLPFSCAHERGKICSHLSPLDAFGNSKWKRLQSFCFVSQFLVWSVKLANFGKWV